MNHDSYLKMAHDIVIRHVQGMNVSVFLFGSRARGDRSRAADIDIGFLSDKGGLVEESRLKRKLQTFALAVDHFRDALAIESGVYPETVRDTIDSGKIRRFDVCVELAWKILKVYLLDMHGIDVRTPKQVIKEGFIVKDI